MPVPYDQYSDTVPSSLSDIERLEPRISTARDQLAALHGRMLGAIDGRLLNAFEVLDQRHGAIRDVTDRKTRQALGVLGAAHKAVTAEIDRRGGLLADRVSGFLGPVQRQPAQPRLPAGGGGGCDYQEIPLGPVLRGAGAGQFPITSECGWFVVFTQPMEFDRTKTAYAVQSSGELLNASLRWQYACGPFATEAEAAATYLPDIPGSGIGSVNCNPGKGGDGGGGGTCGDPCNPKPGEFCHPPAPGTCDTIVNGNGNDTCPACPPPCQPINVQVNAPPCPPPPDVPAGNGSWNEYVLSQASDEEIAEYMGWLGVDPSQFDGSGSLLDTLGYTGGFSDINSPLSAQRGVLLS